LDLVGNEQRAVAAAELGGGFQIIRRGKVNPLALDRFYDKCSDGAPTQGGLQCVQVVERNCRTIAKERLKSLLKNSIPIQRERAESQTVKGMLAGQNSGAPCCRAREFDRGFNRFGSGIGKEN